MGTSQQEPCVSREIFNPLDWQTEDEFLEKFNQGRR